MSKLPPDVEKFRKKYNLGADEFWPVHGKNWVVLHKALERVAAEQGITFDRPAMLETSTATGIVALVVFGKLGDRQEWSIGEASPKNNKNAYPYAMAEKRAKDRVILKLLNTEGAVTLYSSKDEFEAEEATEVATKPAALKRENPHKTKFEDVFEPIDRDENGEPVDNIPNVGTAEEKLTMAQQNPVFKALRAEIEATGSKDACRALIKSEKFLDRFKTLREDWQEYMRAVNRDHMDALDLQERGDKLRERMTA
jgi:hypothetical protein